MIVEDLAMIAVLQEAAKVAESDLDVVLLGETGVGKELLARGIHELSRRSNGPFVAINVAALPETMIESELFGYEKGAFTGAFSQHVGRFEQANGGVLFLDEIGHLPLSLQPKLLRALENKTFERLGGRKSIRSDVRILAATDKDLIELVKAGLFEGSLYFRFQAAIRIPPLRDRPADITALAQHFLPVYNRKHFKDLKSVSPEALAYLRRHPLPGNVRQLLNALECAVVRAEPTKQTLEVDDFQGPLAAWEASPHPLMTGIGLSELDRLTLDQILEVLIRRRLEIYKSNKTKAADSLGISRGTFRAWCRKYGIELEE